MPTRSDRKPLRRILTALALLVPLSASTLISGCGSATDSSSGGARVNVAVSAATPYQGGSTLSAASLSPSAVSTTTYDHAWITVHRVSLLPDDGSAAVPDPAGEGSVFDASGEAPAVEGSVSVELSSPVELDLLNLPASSGALLLDSFPSVPAGTYRKLRLEYTNPKVHAAGAADNTAASATAHYHMDLHFTGSGLVLTEGTGSDVRVADVGVTFLPGSRGLKIEAAGGRILMRPQVFCTVTAVSYTAPGSVLPPLPPPVEPPPPAEPPATAEVRLLDGSAVAVDGFSSTAAVATSSGATVNLAWNGATAFAWADRDFAPSRIVSVDAATGASSFQAGALVAAIGTVDGSGTFLASSITISFPAKTTGTFEPIDPADFSAFMLLPSGALVFPTPSVYGTYYDDASGAAVPSGFALLFPGASVTVRGYEDAGALNGWWISL
jgi:hypothetical protein